MRVPLRLQGRRRDLKKRKKEKERRGGKYEGMTHVQAARTPSPVGYACEGPIVSLQLLDFSYQTLLVLLQAPSLMVQILPRGNQNK